MGHRNGIIGTEKLLLKFERIPLLTVRITLRRSPGHIEHTVDPETLRLKRVDARGTFSHEAYQLLRAPR